MINKICKEHDVSDKLTLFYVLGWIIINPFYLETILIEGIYDVVVGLCVLLAVYCIDHSEQIKSGIYTAFAFLLKFIGLILAFPVVFMKKKINWRLGLVAVSIGGGIYLLGFIFWGTSVFDPFLTHLLRDPEGSSIFTFIYEVLGIDLSEYMIYLLIIGVVIVIVFFYFQNDDISTYSLILIILLILVLPVLFPHYVLWFLPLTLYWSIKHKSALKRTIILYFIVMGLILFGINAEIFNSRVRSYLSIISFIASAIFVIMIYLENRKENLNVVES